MPQYEPVVVTLSRADAVAVLSVVAPFGRPQTEVAARVAENFRAALDSDPEPDSEDRGDSGGVEGAVRLLQAEADQYEAKATSIRERGKPGWRGSQAQANQLRAAAEFLERAAEASTASTQPAPPEPQGDGGWPAVEPVRDVCDPAPRPLSILTADRRAHVSHFPDEYETRRYVPADTEEPESARLRRALERLQNGPDTLTQDGLRIVHEALYLTQQEGPRCGGSGWIAAGSQMPNTYGPCPGCPECPNQPKEDS
jgi:hypothetical protein